MSTIFTDDFAYHEIDIEIGDPVIGQQGRELCMSAGDHKEIRVMLTDGQLAELADAIETAGIRPGGAA